MPNEYPIMNIRAKYADQTPEGKDIDSELEKKPDGESLKDGTFEGSFKSLKVDTLDSDEDEISANKPIVEVMTGYNFTARSSTENTEIEYVYAGAVKNGNKLTLVLALYLTKIGSSEEISIGLVSVPSAIYSALYPVRIGNYNYLAFGTTTGAQPNYERVNIGYYINKASDNLINFTAQTGSLASNMKTYVRIEGTFLLSDNLAA